MEKDEYIEKLEKEISLLKHENKTLTMKLIGVKTIVNMINPICNQKLEELLNSCSSCKGEE